MFSNSITLRSLDFTLQRRLAAAIFVLLAVRLYAMWYFPLTDNTEARYGELARKMVETGDWITLWHDYGVPFWAKPPLSTWLTAASFEMFGINEFAARLPNLLMSLAALALLYRMLVTTSSPAASRLSVLVLGSMALFYLAAGSVMTDVALLLCCTLSMVSFWFAIQGHRGWGYGFFLALGLGMLAKGPAAVVLSLLPVIAWTLYSRQWRLVLARLPWLAGVPLALAVTLPWYIAAELRTPGFLQYFIVGEHINRFLVAGWEGDLYGSAHRQALGTIWLFLLVDALPWSLVAIPGMIYLRTRNRAAPREPARGHDSYLWCWLLAPLVFFSLAHNILLTYAITALPALAALLGRHLEAIAMRGVEFRTWALACAVIPALLWALVNLNYSAIPALTQSSGREISQAYAGLIRPAADRLAYVGKRSYSLEFYNAGKAVRLSDIGEIFAAAPAAGPRTYALTDAQFSGLDPRRAAMLERLASTRHYALYRLRSGSAKP